MKRWKNMKREEADEQVREKLNRASTGQSEQSPVGGAYMNRDLGNTIHTHKTQWAQCFMLLV